MNPDIEDLEEDMQDFAVHLKNKKSPNKCVNKYFLVLNVVFCEHKIFLLILLLEFCEVSRLYWILPTFGTLLQSWYFFFCFSQHRVAFFCSQTENRLLSLLFFHTLRNFQLPDNSIIKM